MVGLEKRARCGLSNKKVFTSLCLFCGVFSLSPLKLSWIDLLQNGYQHLMAGDTFSPPTPWFSRLWFQPIWKNNTHIYIYMYRLYNILKIEKVRRISSCFRKKSIQRLTFFHQLWVDLVVFCCVSSSLIQDSNRGEFWRTLIGLTSINSQPQRVSSFSCFVASLHFEAYSNHFSHFIYLKKLEIVSSWRFQPNWKTCVKMGIFLK